MKILLVTFSDNADHQDTLFGMFEQLYAQHYDVTLLAIQTPKVPLKENKNTWLVDCPRRPGICKGTFNLPLLFSLMNRIRKEKFDVIWFESLHVWNLPIMMCSGKAKIYHVIHEVVPHEGDRQVKMVDLMNKAICKLTDFVVLRNKTYIAQMSEHYHFPAERIKYSELWRRYPAYTEPSYSGKVLFFGRMNPYKGVDNLLDIVKMCPEVRFEAIGKVDPQVQGIISELEKQPNITLKTGYVSDEEMQKAFIGADWLIVPYNSASQSGIIIDAYKYSRPVIAFDVGAISEQVKDGQSGFLVNAGDNKEFSEVIKKVLKIPAAKYNEMSKYAYQYGCQKYAASGAAKRFVKLLEGDME